MQSKNVLPDVLKKKLDVVFCGVAAGDRSASVGAYYANATNRFWATLSDIRLVSRKLDPQEYKLLLRYGVGLTDLCKMSSGADDRIENTKIDVEGFRIKMSRYKPHFIAFNGKHSARLFFGHRVDYGLQRERLGHTRLYVLPSTSGAARRWWELAFWTDLCEQIRKTQKNK